MKQPTSIHNGNGDAPLLETKEIKGDRTVIPFTNPAAGEQFGSVPEATPEEITTARREMGAAAAIWAAKPIEERVRILRKLQEVIIDSLDEITAVINQDHGKSRQEAWAEVFITVEKMHLYHKKASEWLDVRKVPRGLTFLLSLSRKYYTEAMPFGVVAIVGPWNYPFELVVPAMHSALLAGNAVLVKPSEVSAATGVMIENLINRVPELAPFVRFLHGGPTVGAALVQSQPDLIFLTGSVATGHKVAQAAAERMIPFLCELGGKDPMIVFEDADLRRAAAGAVSGDAVECAPCVTAQFALDQVWPYGRRHPEVGAHVQMVGNDRAALRGDERPGLVADLEVAALRICHRAQCHILLALDPALARQCLAEEQDAATIQNEKARPPVGARLDVALEGCADDVQAARLAADDPPVVAQAPEHERTKLFLSQILH